MCLGLCSSNGKSVRSIGKVYPDDPIKEIRRDDLLIIQEDEIAPDEVDISKANRKWKKSVRHNKDLSHKVEFLISRIPFSLAINPETLIEIHSELYCFVLLAYNSTKDDFDELRFLGTALSAFFHERCGVGMLDIAYPSNNFTFSDVVESTPSFIVKRPHRKDKMLRLFHNHLDPNHLHLMPIEDWGVWIPYPETDIEHGLMETFKFINFIYEIETHANLKVMSIFMPHYSNKRYMRSMITGVKRYLHDKAETAARDHNVIPGKFDPELHDEEIYAQISKRYHTFKNLVIDEMFWNSLDLESLMEQIAEMKEQVESDERLEKHKDDHFHVVPMRQPDLNSLIWSRTIIYPSDEEIEARHKKIKDAAVKNKTRPPGYEVNIMFDHPIAYQMHEKMEEENTEQHFEL